MEEASVVGKEADVAEEVDVEIRKHYMRELQHPRQPTEEGVHTGKLSALAVEGRILKEASLAESWPATIFEGYNVHHEEDV
jgi:hypothetical protein